jgi:hypothetical protein
MNIGALTAETRVIQSVENPKDGKAKHLDMGVGPHGVIQALAAALYESAYKISKEKNKDNNEQNSEEKNYVLNLQQSQLAIVLQNAGSEAKQKRKNKDLLYSIGHWPTDFQHANIPAVQDIYGYSFKV